MGMYLDLDDVVADHPLAKAELTRLLEAIDVITSQLHLANIDAANNEAEANALRVERDRLRAALVKILRWAEAMDKRVPPTYDEADADCIDVARAALKEEV